MELESTYKNEIIKAGILSAQTNQTIFINENKSLVLNSEKYVLSVKCENENIIVKDNEGNLLNKKQSKKSKFISEPEDTSGAVLQDN
jgi:Fe-S cluster biosynthesis and repair protein YggX